MVFEEEAGKEEEPMVVLRAQGARARFRVMMRGGGRANAQIWVRSSRARWENGWKVAMLGVEGFWDEGG